jgi:hypothetical protein
MKVLACWALALVLGLAVGAVVKDSPVVEDSPKPKDSPAAKPMSPSSTTVGPSAAAVVKETVPEECEANICNTRKVTCAPVQQNCTAGMMSRDFGAGYCGCCPACVQLRGEYNRSFNSFFFF